MSGKPEIRRVAGQRYWREAEARVVIDAWQRSGESLSDFSHRHGILRQRLERWARRLGVSEGRVRFHRVRLVERRRSAEAVEASGAPIEIEWGPGRRVRVLPGFAAEDLGRVLEILEGRERC
jgi:hypothetical protein